MTKMDLEPLISSLGTTPDAFYFMTAFASIKRIQDCLGEKPSQVYLDFGLHAAFSTKRADIAKLLLDQGANIEPLIAFNGFEATQKFISIGQQALLSQYIESPPLDLSSSLERTLREQNGLRLLWISNKPNNRTVRVLVEGVEGHQPTALHYQAAYTSFSPAYRIAWMQFDLERSANTHLNRYADNRHIFGTPLHWALDDNVNIWENYEILNFLLVQGADPTIKDHDDQTPRDVCLKRLLLPIGDLNPKMREFYLYAAEELAKAEEKFAAAANRSQSMGLFTKAKSVFGWGS